MQIQILFSYWAGNPSVSKYTRNSPHPYDDALKQTGKLIGAVGLVGVRGDAAGMGYWIGEPFWGHGYCTEAAKALIEYCFNHLNLNRIEAEYMISNPASGRVMQKAGMLFKDSKIIKDRNDNDAELNVYEIKAYTLHD